MDYHVPHWIDGKARIISGRKLPIFHPASGKTIGNLDAADVNVVAEAVNAAQTAFQTWSKTSLFDRAACLFNYKALLEHHIHELAAIVTREHGKTLAEAVGSIRRGIDVVDFACGIATHLQNEFSNQTASSTSTYSTRQPLGACAGITPFNFPAMIPLWMFPLAIACGNTFILKPSEKDPSCALRLVELLTEAGVPSGVVNVVHGDKETVNALIDNPIIKSISFVGSSLVAENVYRQSIMQNKRAQCFGGAKNHCIVMPDSANESTANAIIASAYGCAGERCMAISVVVAVGDQAHDHLLKHFKEKIPKIKVGAGDDPKTEMGPLITQDHLQKVRDYIESGLQEGATLAIDGVSATTLSSGFYLNPCLFTNVKANMRIYQEEIFGPVLVMMKVNSYHEALDLINHHRYANGTSIFSTDGRIARHFANNVQAGMVGINIPIPVPVASHSFGGWKHSVFADIGMYGEEGIRFYTKLKTVTERWVPEEGV